MSARLSIGVMARPGAAGTAADIADQARHAERLGLDGLFIGDHLKPAGPYPESMVLLAAAAGATERIALGVAVMVLALRHPAWAAKQLATLQHVSGGRVVLGVGSGGALHGTEAWDAVGVPFAERGRATDASLALLPALIAGERVELPSGQSIQLAPGAAVPPILVGGNSAAARRRAVRHRAGWFPSMATTSQIREGVRELPSGAEVAVGLGALLGDAVARPRVDAFVASLVAGYGIEPEEAATVPITGTPTEAAERLDAYASAGATWVVLTAIDADWRRQWELMAAAAALL
jgi:alkanesulfonate monooxygenase SsuD/methylene tetrahydromethanopterin reductase-like flavin-dependent oxidoreductase (luciferase family)